MSVVGGRRSDVGCQICRRDVPVPINGERKTDLVFCLSYLASDLIVTEVFKPPMRLTPGFNRGNERNLFPFTPLAASASSR